MHQPRVAVAHRTRDESYISQLRLFLEELCCDFCRLQHAARDPASGGRLRIDREFYLGHPNAYADIRVQPSDARPYFIEVNFGHSPERSLHRLKQKFGVVTPAIEQAERLVVVIQGEVCPEYQDHVAQALPPGLQVEIWGEPQIIEALRDRYQVKIDKIDAETLGEARRAIYRAKALDAFGQDGTPEQDGEGPLQSELMWHFDFWRLRELREAGRRHPHEILPPGAYRGIVVLLADMCSFSSFVRDTPNNAIIRDSLTSFYSKSRYQIINNGGMFYQFVGDEVIGFFGLPDPQEDAAEVALQTALSLVNIGNSVAARWQGLIDREQTSCGVHIGIAVGDLQMVSLRPFSRRYMGAIGDCINLGARLMASAGPSEIMVSNSFYQRLDEKSQALFDALAPLEARNVGRLKAWTHNPLHYVPAPAPAPICPPGHDAAGDVAVS